MMPGNDNNNKQYLIFVRLQSLMCDSSLIKGILSEDCHMFLNYFCCIIVIFSDSIMYSDQYFNTIHLYYCFLTTRTASEELPIHVIHHLKEQAMQTHRLEDRLRDMESVVLKERAKRQEAESWATSAAQVKIRIVEQFVFIQKLHSLHWIQCFI